MLKTFSRLITAERREGLLIGLGLAFGWLSAVALWLQTRDGSVLLALGILSVAALAAHAWLNHFAAARDPLLLPAAVALSAWGLLVIARVAPNFLARQTAWMVVGYMALCAVASSRDRLRWLRRFKYTWLLAALALLAATLLLGVNPTGAGARLWLSVAGFFLQPSEVLKLLLIAFLAAFFAENLGVFQTGVFARSRSVNWKGLAPSFVMWLVALLLLASQQDLGAAALLLLTFAFMLYLATDRVLLPLSGLAALVVAGAGGYFLSARIAGRINIWLNPLADPQGASFQIVQSLIAVASGGVFGQGPGLGRPDYVPAVHTDFPFAAVAEEYGLIGALAVIALFAVLALRAWRIARNTSSSYTLLLAGGLAASFTIQVFVIVGGNLGLLPLTGVTLPFISYGGSSLLVSAIAIGLLIRLSCDAPTHAPTQAQPAASATRPSTHLVLQTTPEQHNAARVATALCAAIFILTALVAGYRGVVQAPSLTARDDNPRKIDAEQAIRRGDIHARDGAVLATALPDPATPAGTISGMSHFLRHYSFPEAAPVVGYYSLRHGVGGLEAAVDATLRGQQSEVDLLLHRPQIGAAYTTTLDLRLQQQIAAAMQGRIGAAVVLDWRSGEVLAMVSMPSFDPNKLDDQWDALRESKDAPLLNRATQGLYQPGSLLAWMHEQSSSQSSVVSSQTVTNGWDVSDTFQLGKPVPFELDNAAVAYPVTATYSETIGQGSLRVTPLRIAVVAASLAAGAEVTPTLNLARGSDGHAANSATRRPFSPFATVAQISHDQYVGWYVAAGARTVLVIALEQTTADTAQVLTVARNAETGN